MSLTVRLLSSVEDAELSSFLDQTARENESVLGYHYPFYRDMLQQIEIGKPLYFGCWKNGNMVGCLPGFVKESDSGSAFSSLPFFGPNAGVITDHHTDENNKIHAALLKYSDAYNRENNIVSASYYTPFNYPELKEYYKEFLPGCMEVEKFTTFIDLKGYELTPALAYDIRKAVKSGVTVDSKIDQDTIEAVYNIYRKNCEDYGIPLKPFATIRYLMLEGTNSANTKTYVARHNDEIIGGLIMIFSPKTASYYLPCSKHEFRSLQPTSFLINHAIKECQERGICYWNWESSPSKESGVYKFKKKWSSQDSTYSVFIKLYKDEDFFINLGKEKITGNWPHFFIFPFSKFQK
jgi:hypothetical protein